jgi:putative Mg2+ transporter-C (MgtC) family protein
MISESQIILRLLIASGIGLIIGYERERQDHAAGLRTHMILIIGATLAMALSINIAFITGVDKPAGDPARMAAQVVSGIGFIGAGVIFRFGTNIRGLTTAASLWTIAIVGLAIGAGMFLAGITTAILLFIILSLLNYLEQHYLSAYNRVHIIIEASYRQDLIDEVKALLEQEKRKLGTFNIERNLVDQKITLDMLVRILAKDSIEGMAESLGGIKGVNQVKISE